MIKEITNISATKKKIAITVPADAIQGEIDRTLEGLKRDYRFPGFRKGKAPMSMVVKKFGKDAEGEAIEKLVPRFYSDALIEAKLSPVGNPQLESKIEYKPGSDMEMVLTVEVLPEIEGLKYEGIEVTDLPAAITDEDIDMAMERLKADKATYEPSENAAADGDVVIMDYEVSGEGVDAANSKFKGEVFKIGSDLMPSEFSKAITGKKKGEAVEFKVNFAPDFYAEEHAGKERAFKVSVNEVKNVKTPTLDDEFAKDLSFDDMAALRKHVGERLEKAKSDSIKRLQKADLLRKLIDNHEFEAPESLVSGELDNLLEQSKHQARAKGEEPDEAKLREELRESAVRHVKASVLLKAIGEKESVDVNESDLQQALMYSASRMGLSPENMVKYYVSRDGSLEGLRQSVYEDKVMDRLLEKAVKAPPKDNEEPRKKESK